MDFLSQDIVTIVDCGIIGKKKHRFPNLASMKLSSYHKSLGKNVILATSWDSIDFNNPVFISKVFTDTHVPEWIFEFDTVEFGGTGFFYDKAPPLPYEIEHSIPDYHLYDSWIEQNGGGSEFKYYTDYLIGFLTRGCFRKCPFCVNKNSSGSIPHSPVSEFYDKARPKLCFLDDNFFACSQRKEIISDVLSYNIPFQFKQGLDERLLNPDVVLDMMGWKYDGNLIFAYDNIEDTGIIQHKLDMMYALAPHLVSKSKFYILCGFDKHDKYDDDFWIQDIWDIFQRVYLLAQYGALPYIMRFEKSYESKYKELYSQIAAWCNQPGFLRNETFEKFCQKRGMSSKIYHQYKNDPELYIQHGHNPGISWKCMQDFIDSHPRFEPLFNQVWNKFKKP